MKKIVAWIKREPAQVWLGWVAAVLGAVATWGLPGLSVKQAALIIAVVNAVAAIISAWRTRPVSPAVFTGAVAAFIALLAGYGVHVSQDALGGINTFVLAALTLLTRGQVTPVAPSGTKPVQ